MTIRHNDSDGPQQKLSTPSPSKQSINKEESDMTEDPANSNFIGIQFNTQ